MFHKTTKSYELGIKAYKDGKLLKGGSRQAHKIWWDKGWLDSQSKANK